MKKYNPGDIFEIQEDNYYRYRKFIAFVITKRFNVKHRKKPILCYNIKYIEGKSDYERWKYGEKDTVVISRFKLGELLRTSEVKFLLPHEAAIFLLKQ